MGKFVPLGGMYPPTKKLFHLDPYNVRCQACVLGVVGEYIILDQTVFYAESGGQESDRGTISGCAVVEVHDQLGRPLYLKDRIVDVPTINVDTIILHKMIGGDIRVGQYIVCEVDWERRYKVMRNHSASHFVYYAANEVFNRRDGTKLFTKGCHINDEGFRFDFSADIPSDWVTEIEEISNGLIARGMDIDMQCEPESTEVFYWTYGDIIIPCGGTHVRSAKELGPLTLKRTKKGKGLTRVGYEGVAGEER